jgi:hypothetical protein
MNVLRRGSGRTEEVSCNESMANRDRTPCMPLV